MSFINSHQLISYLRYYIKAKTVNSVHSPFLYHVLMESLENRKTYNAFAEINRIRHLLAADRRAFEFTDLGAGSQRFKQAKRTVAGIYASSALSHSKGKFLFHLSRVMQAKSGLELGTSLGISALYLCLGNRHLELHTVEGDAFVHELASSHFKQTGVTAIPHLGDFTEILPMLLPTLESLDLVFIDGNHSHDATLSYHQLIKPFLSSEAVVIYDDIYWSTGMTKAWEELQEDPDFQYSVDLFNVGLLMKHEQTKEKQHFTLIERIKKPFSLGFWT